MASMFAAAIFDMDGLLIDSERALLRVWTEVAAEFGVVLAASDFVRMVGLGAAESNLVLRDLLGSEARVQALRATATERLREADAHAPAFPLRAGAEALVRHLHGAGVPLAVASSTRVAEVHRRLERVGLRDAFAAIAGGDEVVRAKPDPAVFRLAAERLGVAPRDCLALEDSPHGCRAAAAAGMRVVLVPDLVPPEPDLRALVFAELVDLDQALARIEHWFPSRAHPRAGDAF